MSEHIIKVVEEIIASLIDKVKIRRLKKITDDFSKSIVISSLTSDEIRLNV